MTPDGLHADALGVLERWAAPSPEQAALRASYVAHLRTHPDGLFKACYPDHLTASALVVNADRSRVLLTLHRKAGLWFQFGGHIEPGDATLAGAAIREATEESGIPGLTLLPGGPVQLDRHAIPAPCHWHLDVQYAALAPAGAVEEISEESLDLRWFAYDSRRGRRSRRSPRAPPALRRIPATGNGVVRRPRSRRRSGPRGS